MNVNIINVGVNNYNSYLIIADKIVLIDTVPIEFSNELLNNICEYIDIEKLDTVIINHTESDRSGALGSILEKNDTINVIASLSGIKNLEQQLNFEFNKTVAKSNSVISFGNDCTLKFIITHNINWPDSMMTYFVEKEILFSCDAFSDANASKKDYFDEHIMPMSSYVENAMEQLKDIKISNIYPAGGSTADASIIDDYILWSQENQTKKSNVTVVFESHTNNNKLIAEYIGSLVGDCNIITADDNGALAFIYNSKGVIFVAPTHYRNIPKAMAELIVNINHYKINNTLFAAVGSYGWSGEAPNLIYSILKARHFNTYKSPFRVMFKPCKEDFDELKQYIDDFLQTINNN